MKGYEIKPIAQPAAPIKTIPIGSDKRPVGSTVMVLEDLKHRGLKCYSIVDVGVNTGSWSRMAKYIFPEAIFSLIEPQYEMKEQLEKFCNDFPIQNLFLQVHVPKKKRLH